METYDRLHETYLRLYEELENDNFDVEQDVLDLEQEAIDALDYTVDKEHQKISQLLLKIKSMKEEFVFYNEESELDMMFPDRHDDDFDEDSMSYESVFGHD